MSHPIPGHHYDENLEALLDSLPDEVADKLMAWRVSTLNREKVEAILYASIKGHNPDKTATEIKAAINSDPSRYSAVLEEIKAESEYTRILERLLSVKKRASLRTAF